MVVFDDDDDDDDGDGNVQQRDLELVLDLVRVLAEKHEDLCQHYVLDVLNYVDVHHKHSLEDEPSVEPLKHWACLATSSAYPSNIAFERRTSMVVVGQVQFDKVVDWRVMFEMKVAVVVPDLN